MGYARGGSHFEVQNRMNEVSLDANKGFLAYILRRGVVYCNEPKFRDGKLEPSYLFINSPLCNELSSCFG